MSERVLRVGMLGCGTVGAAVVRLLDAHRDDIERRAGCRLEIHRVAVRDRGKARDVHPMMWVASLAFLLYFALPALQKAFGF